MTKGDNWLKANQQYLMAALDRIRAAIERHIKVRGEANPYDPIYSQYFERRRRSVWRTLTLGRTGQSLLSGV